MNNNGVKSATVAGLLGIFLGSFGAHDWYLGNKKMGIIHVCLAATGLLVSIIGSMIIPMVSPMSVYKMAGFLLMLSGLAALIMLANGIWGFVEGVMILAKGDAGLAQKGYRVAGMGYQDNNFGYNQGYNQYGQMNGQMNGGYAPNGMNGQPMPGNGMQGGNMQNTGMQQNVGQSIDGVSGMNQGGQNGQ